MAFAANKYRIPMKKNNGWRGVVWAMRCGEELQIRATWESSVTVIWARLRASSDTTDTDWVKDVETSARQGRVSIWVNATDWYNMSNALNLDIASKRGTYDIFHAAALRKSSFPSAVQEKLRFWVPFSTIPQTHLPF
jgi:hypothetical protein